MNIYCGNISYRMTEDDLRELFGEYGNVDDANVIIDRDTGRSKGFGFVEMANDTEANAAIKALDGQENGGRQLRVNEARPREPRR
ncbi:MAG: RNA-binding protein [Chloroflexota bacterium]|nr:RNA-binding protein [Chloroflexota bacterium]